MTTSFHSSDIITFSSSRIKEVKAKAIKKGLKVRKGITGWSITLPNGRGYQATSDSDMVQFVTAY